MQGWELFIREEASNRLSGIHPCQACSGWAAARKLEPGELFDTGLQNRYHSLCFVCM